MRLTCPSCRAELSLDVLLASEEARQVIARLVEISLPFGALTLRYVALFRPKKQRLSHERMVSLLEELLPDVQRGAIQRNGREWDAPVESWKLAIERVLESHAKGSLTTPLTSHGYLYEVLAGLAEKLEAQQEREREQQRQAQGRSAARAAADAAPISAVLTGVAELTAATVNVRTPIAPAGPSTYAQRLKAEIDARRQREATQDGEPT